LRPFARYLERGNDKVYEQNPPSANKEKIQSVSIARRYQINMVIALNEGEYDQEVERYRITLDRTGIIELDKADAATNKEETKQSPYSRLKMLMHFK
jgi:hypothetical protein